MKESLADDELQEDAMKTIGEISKKRFIQSRDKMIQKRVYGFDGHKPSFFSLSH